MADKKNLCAQIDTALHMRVRQEQERSGRTLSEYVEQLITDYYKMKEGTKMTGDMRTMAIQLPEELFERLKAYLKKNNLKQKQFIIGLIEDALEQDGTEKARDLYDASYVELRLIKEYQGEPTAASLFNYGEQFVFNYFELRGAAAKLTEGWTLEQIRDYTIENGCDPTDEEYRESAQALQAFRSQQAHTFSGEMCL